MGNRATSRAQVGSEGSLARARQKLSAWPPLLHRRWRPLGRWSRDLRILSFNLLADCKQNKEQWSATPPDALNWDLRRWRLLEEIMTADADVICLQEADHMPDFFEPELKDAGYSCVQRQKPAPAADSVVVAFRTDRFELLRQNIDLEFAAVAEFRDRDRSERLIVVSAHLASGKRETDELQRASQVSLLLDRAVDLAEKAEVLIGMDMNAEPAVTEKAGELLAYLATLQHEVGLQSAYSVPYTTWKKRPKGEIKRTIDYIFHTNGLVPKALLEMPTEAEMPEERIPTFSYPSDHFALAADFTFASKG